MQETHILGRCVAALALLISLLLLTTATAMAAQAEQPAHNNLWFLVSTSLAFLVPTGFILIGAAGLHHEQARRAALAGVAALGLAIIGFWAVGFAFMFGGIGLTYLWEDFNGLVWQWSLLGPEWGPGWGMVGFSGWLLLEEAATPSAYILFFAQLPWVTTTVAVLLVALHGRAPAPLVLFTGLLTGAVIYPVVGNWIWGGGWLVNLGRNLGLGHGFVDIGGAGGVHLLAAGLALAATLTRLPRRRTATHTAEPTPLPTAHLPLLATVGVLFLAAGSLGWSWVNPLIVPAELFPVRGSLNALLALGAGALAPLLYTWFTAGQSDALMTARGAASGLIAGLALGSFAPLWAAVVLGAITGFLCLLFIFTVDHIFPWEDPSAVIPVHGLGATLGLLGLAIFADGLVGSGWNGIGQQIYLGVEGQGVTGMLAAEGFESAWPVQFQAQLIGVAAIGLTGLIIGSVLLVPFLLAGRVWQQTQTPAATTANSAPESRTAARPDPNHIDEFQETPRDPAQFEQDVPERLP